MHPPNPLFLPPLQREFQPGELYLAAARAAIARRRVADFIRGVHGPEGLPQLHGQVGAYLRACLADACSKLAAPLPLISQEQ